MQAVQCRLLFYLFTVRQFYNTDLIPSQVSYAVGVSPSLVGSRLAVAYNKWIYKITHNNTKMVT